MTWRWALIDFIHVFSEWIAAGRVCGHLTLLWIRSNNCRSPCAVQPDKCWLQRAWMLFCLSSDVVSTGSSTGCRGWVAFSYCISAHLFLQDILYACISSKAIHLHGTTEFFWGRGYHEFWFSEHGWTWHLIKRDFAHCCWDTTLSSHNIRFFFYKSSVGTVEETVVWLWLWTKLSQMLQPLVLHQLVHVHCLHFWSTLFFWECRLFCREAWSWLTITSGHFLEKMNRRCKL